MAKLLFIPVSILGSLVAGALSRKLIDQVWGLIDEEEPPDGKHRDIEWGKLLLAAALQGAIFRADEGGHRPLPAGGPSTAPRAPGRERRGPRRSRSRAWRV